MAIMSGMGPCTKALYYIEIYVIWQLPALNSPGHMVAIMAVSPDDDAPVMHNFFGSTKPLLTKYFAP